MIRASEWRRCGEVRASTLKSCQEVCVWASELRQEVLSQEYSAERERGPQSWHLFSHHTQQWLTQQRHAAEVTARRTHTHLLLRASSATNLQQ